MSDPGEQPDESDSAPAGDTAPIHRRPKRGPFPVRRHALDEAPAYLPDQPDPEPEPRDQDRDAETRG